MQTDIFQLFDGTLKIAGCKKLLWHRIAMDENQMQVLKHANLRQFPFAPQKKQQTKQKKTRKKSKGKANTNSKKLFFTAALLSSFLCGVLVGNCLSSKLRKPVSFSF